MKQYEQVKTREEIPISLLTEIYSLLENDQAFSPDFSFVIKDLLNRTFDKDESLKAAALKLYNSGKLVEALKESQKVFLASKLTPRFESKADAARYFSSHPLPGELVVRTLKQFSKED